MIIHDLIFFFFIFLPAKSLMKPIKEEFIRIFFSVDHITNLFHHIFDIQEHKYDLINFKFESSVFFISKLFLNVIFLYT